VSVDVMDAPLVRGTVGGWEVSPRRWRTSMSVAA